MTFTSYRIMSRGFYPRAIVRGYCPGIIFRDFLLALFLFSQNFIHPSINSSTRSFILPPKTSAVQATRLSVNPSHPSIQSIYPHAHPFFHTSRIPSIRPSIHPSTCPSVLTSIRSFNHSSFRPSVRPFVDPSYLAQLVPLMLLDVLQKWGRTNQSTIHRQVHMLHP